MGWSYVKKCIGGEHGLGCALLYLPALSGDEILRHCRGCGVVGGVQLGFDLVGAQDVESAVCKPARGIGYIAEAVSVLPGILKQFKELPGTVREMEFKKLPDKVRHLLQGDRARKRPGLA